jgi:predicted O-methyltransferase YrrM
VREVAVGFHGFWPGFEPDHFTRRHPYLAQAYRLVPSSRPDVVFYSVFPDDTPPPANDHVRVFYTGEYVEPDLDACDFAFSFLRLDDDRHLRLPSYVPRLYWSGLRPHDLVRNPATLGPAGTRFCNFVYGRSRPERDRIFELVSRLGHVEAPGNAMRNAPPIGAGVAAKLDYLRQFRFTLACENTSAPGYVTEKLVEASLAGSVPIYWGAPDVELDFDTSAFISRQDFPDDESFLERVRAVACDPLLYESIRARSLLHGNEVPEHMRNETALAFFGRIFGAVKAGPTVDVEGFLAPDEFQLLHDLAAGIDRGCIVEIGSYRGRSTVALAQGARSGGGAPLYAIEPHDEFVGEFGGLFGPPDRDAFFRNMLRAGVAEDVHLVNLPSEEVAPGWRREVGMLWIDGDHRYDAVRRDLEVWAPHLAPGAVVALHDAVQPELGPARLVEEEVAAGRFERVGAVEQTVVLRRRSVASPAPA